MSKPVKIFKLSNPNIPRVKEAFILLNYYKNSPAWFQWNAMDACAVDIGDSGSFLNLLSAKMYAAKCNPKIFTGRKCKWVEITKEEYLSDIPMVQTRIATSDGDVYDNNKSISIIITNL